MRSRLLNLATLFSQMLNVVFFDGSPDETISGRAWREGRTDPKWRKRQLLIDRLFRDKLHCKYSHQRDALFARMILSSIRDSSTQTL